MAYCRANHQPKRILTYKMYLHYVLQNPKQFNTTPVLNATLDIDIV